MSLHPQIIPPLDKGIAKSILKHLDPWPGAWKTEALSCSSLMVDPYDQVDCSYMEALRGYSVNRWGWQISIDVGLFEGGLAVYEEKMGAGGCISRGGDVDLLKVVSFTGKVLLSSA